MMSLSPKKLDYAAPDDTQDHTEKVRSHQRLSAPATEMLVLAASSDSNEHSHTGTSYEASEVPSDEPPFIPPKSEEGDTVASLSIFRDNGYISRASVPPPPISDLSHSYDEYEDVGDIGSVCCHSVSSAGTTGSRRSGGRNNPYHDKTDGGENNNNNSLSEFMKERRKMRELKRDPEVAGALWDIDANVVVGTAMNGHRRSGSASGTGSLPKGRGNRNRTARAKVNW